MAPPDGSERWASLDGRRMLVVGASAGIGRALALSAAGAGSSLVLAARRTGPLAETAALAGDAGAVAHLLGCDVTDPGAARALAGEAARLLGGLDAVVFSAGVAPLAPVSATTAAQWQEVLATNLVGAALVSAGALAPLREGAGPARPRPALTMLSTHTVKRPWPGLVAYAASKAALDTLCRGLRREEPWLRVLDVVVGNTVTGFADGWDPEMSEEAFRRWTAEGDLDDTVWSAEQTAGAVLDALVDESGPDDVVLSQATPE